MDFSFESMCNKVREFHSKSFESFGITARVSSFRDIFRYSCFICMRFQSFAFLQGDANVIFSSDLGLFKTNAFTCMQLLGVVLSTFTIVFTGRLFTLATNFLLQFSCFNQASQEDILCSQFFPCMLLLYLS